MNTLTIPKPMFEHYKQWFYGICGWTFTMAITASKGAETFAYAAIGAFGARTGTQLIKLIVKSWKKSWKPMIQSWRAGKR